MGKKHSAELNVKVVDYPNMVYATWWNQPGLRESGMTLYWIWDAICCEDVNRNVIEYDSKHRIPKHHLFATLLL